MSLFSSQPIRSAVIWKYAGSLLVSLAMLCFTTPVLAANGAMMDLAESGGANVDTMYVGTAYEFQLFIENDEIWGAMQYGVQIYSPEGASWTWNSQPDGYGPNGPGTGGQYLTVVPDCRMDPTATVWDFGNLMVPETDVDGISPDTLFPGGAAFWNGLPPGPMEHMMSIHLTPNTPSSSGGPGIICIDFPCIFEYKLQI